MTGRARRLTPAEELVFGEPMSSAKDDLRHATGLARRMVCELGMSERLGRRSLGRPAGGAFLDDGTIDPDYSGEVAALIDREIQRIVDEGFARATDILVRHRDTLEALADLLVQRETLREPELVAFVTRVAQAGRGHERAGDQPALVPPPP